MVEGVMQGSTLEGYHENSADYVDGIVAVGSGV